MKEHPNPTIIKIKKCVYRSRRIKNANSDSRETNLNKKGIPKSPYLMEFAFLTKFANMVTKIKISILKKIKISLILFIKLVSHNYNTTFFVI